MIDRITQALLYVLLLPVILAVAAGCLVVAGIYMLRLVQRPLDSGRHGRQPQLAASGETVGLMFYNGTNFRIIAWG